MNFPKVVFIAAGVWGIVVLTPLYFILDVTVRQYAPQKAYQQFFDSEDAPKPKTSTVTRTARTTPNEQPRVVLQGVLRPPRGSSSGASGETAIVQYRKANQFKLLLAAKDLKSAPKGSAYAVWLYNSPVQTLFIGFPRATVSDAGTLEVVAELAPQTPTYGQVLLTLERVPKPTKPGKVILGGKIAVPPQPQRTSTAPPPTQTQTTP